MDAKIDHEYSLLVIMGIGCVAIEAFATVAKMDFVQCVAEFDPVVVFEPKRFVAVNKEWKVLV